MSTNIKSGEIKNAVIKSTRLGVAHTDHGILSFSITLDYGGAGQAYGQLVLDDVNPLYQAGDRKAPVRIATSLGSSLLLAVDRVFKKDWEDLRGISCRALIEEGRIVALGDFLRDEWLWFDGKEFAVSTLEDRAVSHFLKKVLS